MNKMYKKVDVHENQINDDPTDACGYLGQFYREKRTLQEISFNTFVRLLKESDKIIDVFKIIKEIDQDHNGFVTLNELDDILKLICSEQLADKNLEIIIKKFCSMQNKILIDYKRFRQAIIDHPIFQQVPLQFSPQGKIKEQNFLDAKEKIRQATTSVDRKVSGGSRNLLMGSLSAAPLQDSPHLR